jgi:hypothetical protein
MIEMVQPFLETEVGEVVGAEFVAEESRELFLLLEEGALEIGTEDMMAMLDLIDDGSELAAVPAVQAGAEDLGNLVGGKPPQAEFTTSLEQLVDGKVALENKSYGNTCADHSPTATSTTSPTQNIAQTASSNPPTTAPTWPSIKLSNCWHPPERHTADINVKVVLSVNADRNPHFFAGT